MKMPPVKLAFAVLVGVCIAAWLVASAKMRPVQNAPPSATQVAEESNPATDAQPASIHSPSAAPAVVAPFIVKDAETDSPGTNMVTRIVTFTAAIGGTPAPALKWKVNHGDGFEALAGATNATFRIGNAQVLDSGFYLLFATNSAGSVSTTPQQLIVTEGQD
jgi:hypothetical protein